MTNASNPNPKIETARQIYQQLSPESDPEPDSGDN